MCNDGAQGRQDVVELQNHEATADATDGIVSVRAAVLLLLTLSVAALVLTLFSETRNETIRFDGLDYLTNSRILCHGAGWTNAEYVDSRPPLISLAFLPAHFANSFFWRHALLRLTDLLIVLASMVALYHLLRLSFGPAWCMLGVLVLVVNPLFVNYAYTFYADILSMLVTTLVLICLARAREAATWQRTVGLAAALALCMLSKYPLLVTPFVALGVDYGAFILSEQTGRRSVLGLLRPRLRSWFSERHWTGLHLVCGVCMSFALFHVAQVAVLLRAFPHFSFRYANVHFYIRLFRTFFLHRGSDIFERHFAELGLSGPYMGNPVHEYVSTLVGTLSVPVCLASLAGAFVALRMRKYFPLLVLGVSVTFFTIMTFVMWHKEARYVFPIVPGVIYLALLGTQHIEMFVESKIERPIGRSIAGLGLILCIFLWAIPPAVRAWGTRVDPALDMSALREAADMLREQVVSRGRPVLWEEWADRLHDEPPPYSHILRPLALHGIATRNPVFLPYDEFWGFRSLSARTFEYMLDSPVGFLAKVRLSEVEVGSDPVVERREKGGCTYLFMPEGQRHNARRDLLLLAALPDGGAVITPGGGHCYTAIHQNCQKAPYPPLPITVTLVERLSFVPTTSAADIATYRSTSGNAADVLLKRDAGRYRLVRPHSLADYTIYISLQGNALERQTGLYLTAPPERIDLARFKRIAIPFGNVAPRGTDTAYRTRQ